MTQQDFSQPLVTGELFEGNMKFWLTKCFKSDLHEACCIFRSVLRRSLTRSSFNLQPVQAMWPFVNYFIHPLNMLIKHIPILLLESLHTFLRGEGMHGLSLIPQKSAFPKAPKKKSQERTGLRPTCMLEVKKDMELNNPLIQMDFNNFLEGRARHGERSTRRTPWKRETPRSWNHLKTMSHLGVLWWKTEAMY